MGADTLPKLFCEAVEKWRDRVALRQKDFGIWQEVTWHDYFEHVRDFALGLHKLGLTPGTKVCIQSENTQEWLYADLAIQSMGAVTVGVYPTNPAKELAYIMDDAEAEFFISENQEHVDKILEVRDRLPRLRKIIVMNAKGIKKYNDPMIISFKEVERLGRAVYAENPVLFMERVRAGKPDDPSVFIYTSGTTGDPKGAIISHRNVIETTRVIQDTLQLTPEDSHISYLPLCHAFERVFALYTHLMVGYVVNFAESTDSVQKDLQELAPTIFITVPRILEKMQASITIKMDNSSNLKRRVFDWGLSRGKKLALKYLNKESWTLPERLQWLILTPLLFNPLRHFTGLKRARYILCAGAPLPPEVSLFFHSIGIKVREGFGMTELTSVTTMQYDDIKIGTVGKPFPGYEVRIAEDGEIVFRTPGIFQGYYRRPEATAEVKRDGWLYTGDLGELDADGHLKIIGRKKDIIITSGGKNISPQFIENKLKASPYIREALVVGDGRKYLGALIQIETDVVGNWAQNQGIPYTTIRDLSSRPEVIALIQKEVDAVNAELARVEQIKKFVLIDRELYHEEGDLTATQKVRRKVMEQKFAAQVEALYREESKAG